MFLTLLAVASRVCAGSLVHETDPTLFFDTLAERLLTSESKMSIHRIQIWPTNNYNASVHRLLQLSANIYDCTTNSPASLPPYLPSVFRPMFTNDAGSIYIRGFEPITNAECLSRPRRRLDRTEDRAALATDDMVEGIPLVMAVRKGLPNFNQFVAETSLQATRKLEFRRGSGNPHSPITETNQMYQFSISNVLGVECWNSYASPFPRAVEIRVATTYETFLTNGVGLVVLSNVQISFVRVALPAGSWRGCTNLSNAQSSFIIPVLTNFMALPLSVYSSYLRHFIPATGVFERINSSFPVPDLWFRQRVGLDLAIVDTESNRILDYVSLHSVSRSLDVMYALQASPDDNFPCRYPYRPSGAENAQWCTNRYGGRAPQAPTFGILNQIKVSQGTVSSDWAQPTNYMAVDFFRAQFGLSPNYPPGTTFYLTNIFCAPYSPSRTLLFRTLCEANDPLVHYIFGPIRPELSAFLSGSGFSSIANLGFVNSSFPGVMSPSMFLGDYRIRTSDSWSFPTNQALSLSWLGRVHRGTPWQTVYWQNKIFDWESWRAWASPSDPVAASAMFPTNDWRLIDILAPLFVEGFPGNAVSPNDRSAQDWNALLDGISVSAGVTVSSNSPEAALIANGIIENQRQQNHGRFLSVGALFATPELTTASPYLASMDSGTISDEVYEAIPAALLPKLRADALLHADTAFGSLTGSGLEGYTYVLETSLDLGSWSPISTNPVVGGAFKVALPPPNAAGSRFYRSVREP